ncbi:membrane protein [Mycobacterium phage Vetrix]|nr:membrane protein [Mycobacterium phage Vetrix]
MGEFAVWVTIAVIVVLVVKVVWPLLLGVTLVWLAYLIARKIARQQDAQAAERAKRDQALIEQADWQHQRTLDGFEDGIYGKYPPAKLDNIAPEPEGAVMVISNRSPNDCDCGYC